MSADTRVVVDITRGLLRVTEEVLLSLGRLLPGADRPAREVRRRMAGLVADLERRPDTVLAATQDDELESLLFKFGPGDPFAARPLLPVDQLRPGDMIVRCSPALSSQLTELMIWSRYTHSGLYVGEGMIVDSTWQYGVSKRSLDELLDESNRVGVMRVNGLTDEQLQTVVGAAESRESAAYNFEGVRVLGAQKLEALTARPQATLGELLTILERAEYLPPGATGGGAFACSELLGRAFGSIHLTLSHASGFTPGDLVRLGQAGQMLSVGRLRAP